MVGFHAGTFSSILVGVMYVFVYECRAGGRGRANLSRTGLCVQNVCVKMVKAMQ